jgi:DNA-binding IclR family transcriptional regulator
LKVIERSLQALEVLAEQSDGIGVVRLAELLGEPPSTVHRLLGTLAAHGYVYRDPATRRYRLGSAVLKLAQAYQLRDMLVAVARPHLAALSARTLESVFLSELVGDDVICVASSESPRPLSFYMRLGQRTPYHAASSARAILAYRPAEDQLRLMQGEHLERFTSATPTTVSAALAELDRTRERGYAICDQEMEEGVGALSVAVRNAGGEVTASITLVAPQDRLISPAREDLVQLLRSCGTTVSAGLGFRGPEQVQARTLAAG